MEAWTGELTLLFSLMRDLLVVVVTVGLSGEVWWSARGYVKRQSDNAALETRWC